MRRKNDASGRAWLRPGDIHPATPFPPWQRVVLLERVAELLKGGEIGERLGFLGNKVRPNTPCSKSRPEMKSGPR
jgi:hypothetical protein